MSEGPGKREKCRPSPTQDPPDFPGKCARATRSSRALGTCDLAADAALAAAREALAAARLDDAAGPRPPLVDGAGHALAELALERHAALLAPDQPQGRLALGVA